RLYDHLCDHVLMSTEMLMTIYTEELNMTETALVLMATTPHQLLAPRATHTSAIRIHRPLRRLAFRPVASAAIGLRNVGPHRHGLEVDQHLVAVIPPVGDDLDEFSWGGARGMDGLDLFRRGNRGVDETRRIPDVGTMQRHRYQRAAVEVHGVLRFVREMRAPILHLRDLRVGIRRVGPVLVRGPLLPAPIEPRQGFAGGCFDARRDGQPCQEFLIALTG